MHYIRKDEKQSFQDKIFIWMLKITCFLLVMDIMSRFDGNTYIIYPYLNHIGNFFVFIFNLWMPSLWLLYVHYQVFQDEKSTKKLALPFAILNGMNAILVILTQFYGWFYYIDSENVYHRGPLFLSVFLLSMFLNLMAIVLVVIYKKRVDKKYYNALIWFSVPPLVSILIQFAFYGISMMLNSITISLLIVFVFIQNQTIYTDYLTGVNNRKKLDYYLQKKISDSTENKTFSAIMIDLNDFKAINDKYGHDAGDYALKVFIQILNNCIKKNDFIARYGGDEFCAILEISNEKQLKVMVDTIKDSLHSYNKTSGLPYIIDISAGYAVYNYRSSMNKEEFLKMLDQLMYENKQLYKSQKQNNSSTESIH
jgi:diguanylate cyclase (GGDEF) domain